MGDDAPEDTVVEEYEYAVILDDAGDLPREELLDQLQQELDTAWTEEDLAALQDGEAIDYIEYDPDSSLLDDGPVDRTDFSAGLELETYAADYPTRDEFSILDEPEMRVLDEKLEAQRFHYEEVKDAYQRGDNYSLTVLLSTFFESFLSTKLSSYVERADTLLTEEDVTGEEGNPKDHGMQFSEIMNKMENADLFVNNREQKLIKDIWVSRCQYIHNGETYLHADDSTRLEEQDKVDAAVSLYEARLGIEPDDRVVELERDEMPVDDRSEQRYTDAIEYMIENGSKASTTIMLNDFFFRHMIDELNKPGSGRYNVNGSKRTKDNTSFNDALREFKNRHLGLETADNFTVGNYEISHMEQIFNAVHEARDNYAHNLKAFAGGNGLDENRYDTAVHLARTIMDNKEFYNGKTYEPASESSDRFAPDVIE